MHSQAQPSSSEALVTTEMIGAVALVTLNRPDKRNALSLTFIQAIKHTFASLPASAKVVVLKANGEHFCAGLDLSELQVTTPGQGVLHSREWYDSFRQIQFGRLPVVSLLHGAVVGGGLELASSTHVRVAEESAYFGLPEGQRGIFLGGGGSVRLPKLIGFSRVMEMMLTGRVYSAAEAAQMGLVHHVTPKGEGLPKAMEMANRIACNSEASNFAILQALPLIAEQSMEHGLLAESLMAAVTASDVEANARITAFLEKRAAKVSPT